MFDHVRIVLVNPSHPGNIGAAARAMRAMGFSKLCLVAPQVFPHAEATARAAGADDVLTHAMVVDTVAQALVGCHVVFATSARPRTLSWPYIDPTECAQMIVSQHQQAAIAILFGSERAGLSNEALTHSHYHVIIPTEDDFNSLNLSAAVQVMVYEIRKAWLAMDSVKNIELEPRKGVTADQMAGVYRHLEETLIHIRFLNPRQPKRLMQRLMRLFNRAQMDVTELNILRGILNAIHRYPYCQGDSDSV
ncbi:MAG: tRNA (cytosine(32)/uridine(32)-2'-O)-methyltransferase TrmJ [Coxiella sp. RIFCSPHIGHO2_12_FULL_44_14]|nr:MAG: tRNA (cytosine(32)/uridine(32)-2'-O)-methyltransferase TrmJ [Coxiella sp. RIFCSPHIGHO2_12_FULL_44_14]